MLNTVALDLVLCYVQIEGPAKKPCQGVEAKMVKQRNRKRISIDDERRWLEQYEAGTSQSALASKTGRNIRTIQKHIQRAFDDREHSMARTDLYRSAITKHNSDLLGALGTMRGLLTVPRDQQATVRPGFRDSLGVRFYGGFVHYRSHEIIEGQSPSVPEWATDDQLRLRELARMHLKRDKKLWSGIDAWQQSLREYVLTCANLGEHVGETATSRLEIGLTPLEGGIRGVKEGIHEGFISSVCHLSIEGRGSAEEPKIVDGRLHYGGSAVITSQSPETLKDAQALFKDLVGELKGDERIIKIVALKTQLDREAPLLQRFIGDILLGGVVVGRCSVCQRLG